MARPLCIFGCALPEGVSGGSARLLPISNEFFPLTEIRGALNRRSYDFDLLT